MRKGFVVSFSVFCLILLLACGSTPVNIVKGGTLPFDKSTTVGDAFDGYKYFSNKKWRAFEDGQKRTIVEFRADYDLKYLYDNPNVPVNFEQYTDQYKQDLSRVKSIQYVVQFLLGKDGKSFEIGYVGLEYNFKDGKAPFDQKIGDISYIVVVYKNIPFLSLMHVAAVVEGQM